MGISPSFEFPPIEPSIPQPVNVELLDAALDAWRYLAREKGSPAVDALVPRLWPAIVRALDERPNDS